jgi:spore coat protein U-like protein
VWGGTVWGGTVWGGTVDVTGGTKQQDEFLSLYKLFPRQQSHLVSTRQLATVPKPLYLFT